MKKKLIVALSLLSTFALASCFSTQSESSNGTSNVAPSTVDTPSSNTPSLEPSTAPNTNTPNSTPNEPSPTPIIIRTKDRGTVDETMESVDIPDAIKPLAPDSTEAGYKVMHLLENAKGEYDLVALQTLTGTIGENTAAEANNYNGYTVEQFDQTAILEDGSTTIEIKYKAKIGRAHV